MFFFYYKYFQSIKINNEIIICNGNKRPALGKSNDSTLCIEVMIFDTKKFIFIAKFHGNED